MKNWLQAFFLLIHGLVCKTSILESQENMTMSLLGHQPTCFCSSLEAQQGCTLRNSDWKQKSTRVIIDWTTGGSLQTEVFVHLKKKNSGQPTPSLGFPLTRCNRENAFYFVWSMMTVILMMIYSMVKQRSAWANLCHEPKITEMKQILFLSVYRLSTRMHLEWPVLHIKLWEVLIFNCC